MRPEWGYGYWLFSLVAGYVYNAPDRRFDLELAGSHCRNQAADLEQAAMADANTGRPHRRKERILPGPDALTAAAKLRTATGTTHHDASEDSETGSAAIESETDVGATVYDLSIYKRASRGPRLRSRATDPTPRSSTVP